MATNIELLLFLDRCPGGYNLWRCYSAQMIGFGEKYFVVLTPVPCLFGSLNIDTASMFVADILC